MKNKILILLFLACTAVSNAQLSMITDASGNASMENGSFTTDVNTFNACIGKLRIANANFNLTNNILGLWAGNYIELLPGTSINVSNNGSVKLEHLIIENPEGNSTGKMANNTTKKTTITLSDTALAKLNALKNNPTANAKLETSHQIYPNPANSSVTISIPANDELIEAQVYDSSGKLVLTTSETNDINLTSLPAGTYLVKARTKLQSFTEKIIKQ